VIIIELLKEKLYYTPEITSDADST